MFCVPAASRYLLAWPTAGKYEPITILLFSMPYLMSAV
jgi:hypothetical protein